MGHTRLIFQGMFNQLKWRSKAKHLLNCPGRSNLHIIVRRFRDVLTSWHIAKTLRHVGKSIIGMEKTAGSWIDESDSAGHVGQHFFVEDDFTLQTLFGFQLSLVIPAAQPCEDRGEDDQPGCQHSHSSQKIMNRFVSQGPRLLYYSHPTARINRAERIEIALSLEMPAPALANLFDQSFICLRCRGYGIWLEIAGKKRHAVLIEYLKNKAI